MLLSLRRAGLSWLTIVGVVAGASVASAVTTLTFENLANGEAGPYTYVTVDGTVNITADVPPPGNHLGLAAFDSDPAGPNAAGGDPDLLVDTGMILILQNNNLPNKTGNNFDTPDDDENGGMFGFTFSTPSTLQSVDLIDINGGGQMTTVTLTDTALNTRTYDVPDEWTGDIDQGDVGIGTLDLTTLLSQAGVGPGNPLATVSEDAGFDASLVQSLEINFMGSAGLDNLSFVPEPSTALMLAMGLIGLAANGSRRRS